MIPKVIHYCWFGNNPKTKLAKKCIKSWHKHCKDYQFIEWNEDNFDISNCPLYVQQAYDAKKWAFVTDYVRLKVIYDFGGIYFDTDVEVKKALDSLLSYSAFFGMETDLFVNTGLGFGAEKGHLLVEKLLDDYLSIPFALKEDKYDLTPCPERNCHVFEMYGFEKKDAFQMLSGNVAIFPSIVFCPIDYKTNKYQHSSKTISVHWFAASWLSLEAKRYAQRKRRENKIDWIKHIPNRILMGLMGIERYRKFKNIIKR